LTDSELSNLIIYGHCAGTAIATEIAHQLEDRGVNPSRVVLAAAMPPGVPTQYTMPRETHQEIIKFLASLGGLEEGYQSSDWKIMVEEFQRDSRMVRCHYEKLLTKPWAKLRSPLTVIVATDDPLTEGHESHAGRWSEIATDYRIETLSGGHFFINTAAESVANIITSKPNKQ